ncbi:cell wall-binding repeat-containing protein [Herbiconiux sp.]|uniref:cell wall-binding repeat-containing protein n=1 Tax=Herbiconiux sp. TaxID=1871186 RepID=UPI0025BA807C|nr:cell wall-binding repeat-containing protein [Herbiconiux sp.]
MRSLRHRLAVLASTSIVVASSLGSFTGVTPAHAANTPLPSPGATALVSASSSGAANYASFVSSISDDGRFVAFSSDANNLTSIPTGFMTQVFVRDMSTGLTQMVSVNSAGTAGGDGPSYDPSISGDGRFIAFTSGAKNLDASLPLADDHTQIYIRDLAAGSTRLVTRNTTATAGGQYNSYSPSLSGDGTRLVFGSVARDLLSGVDPGKGQIFRAEVVAGSMKVTGIVSTADTGAPSPGEAGNGFSYEPSLSHDGTVVAFTSRSSNLTADTFPPSADQIFVHSLETSRTRLVSLAASGLGGADSIASGASISSDGRRVAFISNATNLAPNSPSTGTEQVYLRDLSQSTSELLSVTGEGEVAAGRSLQASISGDGLRVGFTSNARDITRADTRGTWQVYWRDVPSRVTMLASSSTADPTRGSDDSGVSSPTTPRMSSNGQQIAFSAAANLLGAGSPGPAQVYLHGLKGPSVDRIGGADRYAVSAAVSAATFPPGVPVAYVASGAIFSDALSGSAAAGAQGSPVLLVSEDAVPDSIADELRRLHPASIVILGGADTISSRVETALGAFGASVSRVAGSDRFAVSAAISAARFPKGTPIVFVASGEVFPDALSGSAAAGLLAGPVLLVTKDSIPASVSAELARLAPNEIVVLGGRNTISDTVASDLGKRASLVRRIGGADRFEVSAGVSQDLFPNG